MPTSSPRSSSASSASARRGLAAAPSMTSVLRCLPHPRRLRGVEMCEGGRLLADFTAGEETRPEVPDEVAQAVVPTVDGRWVVWAHKIARPAEGGFLPL